MLHTWVTQAVLAVIVFVAAPPVYGQDLNALKASFTAEIAALDTKNLAAA